MRKAIKTLVITAILMGVFAVPVFGQEVTDPKKVYKEDAFNIDEGKLIEDFHKGEVWRCENYIEYLDGVIYNLNETVRIKQEVVTNYKYLAQFNPYYNTLIPAAERDLAQAKAWVAYYEQYKKAARSDLKAKYKY